MLDKPLRHWHKLLIDGEFDDFFSEIMHEHDGGGKAHQHAVAFNPGYIKVDQPLAE